MAGCCAPSCHSFGSRRPPDYNYALFCWPPCPPWVSHCTTSLCAALFPPHVLLQDLPALEGLRGEPQPTLPLMATSAACHVTALQQGCATWPNSPPPSNPARFKDMQPNAPCGNPCLPAPPPPPRSSWPSSCRSGRGRTGCGCTAAGRQEGGQADDPGAAWRGWAGEAPLQVCKLSSPPADAPQQPNQPASG